MRGVVETVIQHEANPSTVSASKSHNNSRIARADVAFIHDDSLLSVAESWCSGDFFSRSSQGQSPPTMLYIIPGRAILSNCISLWII